MQVRRILWLYGYDATVRDLRDGSQRCERTVVSVDAENDDAARAELDAAYGRLGYAVQAATLVDKARLNVDLASMFERYRQAMADFPMKKTTPDKED